MLNQHVLDVCAKAIGGNAQARCYLCYGSDQHVDMHAINFNCLRLLS